MRELQEGYRPDVVIFYDGVNDTTSAVLSGEAGLTTNEINRRREFNLLQSPRQARRHAGRQARCRLGLSIASPGPSGAGSGGPIAGSSSPLPDEAMHRLAGDVADRYVANVKMVETLGRGYGFRPFFFWQPMIFNKAELTAVEREEAQRYAWTEPAFRAVYEQISTSRELKADPAFHDLSGDLRRRPEDLVFIDYCHTTEAANARIADQMAATVFASAK